MSAFRVTGAFCPECLPETLVVLSPRDAPISRDLYICDQRCVSDRRPNCSDGLAALRCTTHSADLSHRSERRLPLTSLCRFRAMGRRELLVLNIDLLGRSELVERRREEALGRN